MTTIDDSSWRAIETRELDDSFRFGVRSTGIYCRSGCPARTPARRNVQTFASGAEARAAGFRACKRCAPDDARGDADLVARIERAAQSLSHDADATLEHTARDAGLSRFHFQRAFRRIVGVTPGSYQRAARAQRLRDALRTGATVTRAIADAGFASASVVYDEAALGMTPSRLRDGGRGETLTFGTARCSLGWALVATGARGIAAIELADTQDAVAALFAQHFPHATRIAGDAAMHGVLAAVVALIDDGSAHLDLALDVRGTAFQQRVWQAIRDVPLGTSITYSELADSIGRPGAARAVAAACAANTVAVAIPCHRVVRTNGDLAGYRWGVERKRALLQRERETTGR